MIKRARGRLDWLLRRTTAEILVLTITFTICLGLAVSGVSGIIYVFLNPGSEVLNVARLIAGVVNTMIGLLAGFLAGSIRERKRDTPPEDDEDGC